MTTPADRPSPPVARTPTDAERIDWLEARVADSSLTLSEWDHDGRRWLLRGRRDYLLIHKMSSRGGEDESLRAAIDAAMGVRCACRGEYGPCPECQQDAAPIAD